MPFSARQSICDGSTPSCPSDVHTPMRSINPCTASAASAANAPPKTSATAASFYGEPSMLWRRITGESAANPSPWVTLHRPFIG